ncbi:MAG: YggS family pyridoxal phosphate-dependent enzyme [Desulfohalobium sp.]
MQTQTAYAERLREINEAIAAAARGAGRDPAEVTLVAVSKYQPVAALQAVHAVGQADFGENYIQEALEKQDQIAALALRWHFIGHLQRNKAKFVPGRFDLVHTVDSLRLAQMLDKKAAEAGVRQDILLQVNLGGEAQKAGLDPEALWQALDGVAELPHLRLRGLMTMPPFFNDPKRVRPLFARLRELRDAAATRLALALPHLSMGMSGDFEVAIAEGATLVRIGTRLFGPRPQKSL